MGAQPPVRKARYKRCPKQMSNEAFFFFLQSRSVSSRSLSAASCLGRRHVAGTLYLATDPINLRERHCIHKFS
eukprot:6460645-Amphidinium_carterae.4